MNNEVYPVVLRGLEPQHGEVSFICWGAATNIIWWGDFHMITARRIWWPRTPFPGVALVYGRKSAGLGRKQKRRTEEGQTITTWSWILIIILVLARSIALIFGKIWRQHGFDGFETPSSCCLMIFNGLVPSMFCLLHKMLGLMFHWAFHKEIIAIIKFQLICHTD